MVQVALATKNLEIGTVIKEDDVKVAEWPGAIPVGATTQVKDNIRPGCDYGHLRQGADHRIASRAEGRRRWNGRHDSTGNARRGRSRE